MIPHSDRESLVSIYESYWCDIGDRVLSVFGRTAMYIVKLQGDLYVINGIISLLKNYRMYQIKTNSITIIAAAMLLLAGCKKDNTATLTADDASDAMSAALGSSTDGLSSQVSTAASYAVAQGAYKTTGTQTLQCGVAFDTTVAFNYSGGATTASYTGQWEYLLTCTGSQSLAMTGSYSGNFDAPRISSTNSGQRQWVLSGITGSTSDPYTFSGTLTRTGSHTSKVRNRYPYTVDMTVTVTNLTVSKTTYEITGGTGTVTMTGTVSNGNSYTFNGNITFLGGGAATLTINGNTYNVTL